MKHSRVLILIPLLALGACASSSYCEGEQKYQTAISVPSLQSTEGLQLRESATALKIPPAPENAVPYGEAYKDEDGDDAIRCLDRPPDMPPLVEPKPEPAPAQPAQPVPPTPSEQPAQPVPPG